MDVDVNQLRIDADVDNSDRMPAPFEHPLVAIFKRVQQRPRADRTSVDREHDSIPAASAHPRLAHHPGHERHPDHLEHLGGDRQSVHRPDGAPPVTIAGAADSAARVDRQLKSDMRMEQGKAAHDILDGGHLGVIGLKKFQPGRHVGEQVLDLERQSGQQRAGAVLDDIARSHPDTRACAAAFDIRHRRDAR